MTDEDFNPLKLFKSLFQKQKEQADSSAKQNAAVVRFLDWMETLDFDQRIKRILDLGKECLSDNQAAAEHAKRILKALEQGSFYERQLALMSCPASRDTEMLMRFTRDASRLLRQLAADLSVQNCTDADMGDILLSTKLKGRRRILKKLRRAKRQSAIDSFLAAIEDKEPDDFKVLVYFGSTEVVKAAITKVGDRMSSQDASRFAYLHADLCLDFLSEYAKTAVSQDPRLLSLLFGAHVWISRLRPERTLLLFESLLSIYPASRLPYRVIIQLRPAEAAKLFARQVDYGGVDLSPVLHRLPDEMVLQAIGHKQFANSILGCFDRLSAALREEVFARCKDGWRNSDGAIGVNVLEKLKKTERTNEARKQLALPNLAGQPSKFLNYARLLEWGELQETVAQPLNNPDPETRGLAFFNLVQATKFERERLTEVLELLNKRKNEPDPVRDKFLSALSLLPPSIFGTESLSRVNLVFEDALKAQDVSFGSLSSMGRLLLRLFPFHPEWVLEQLVKLLRDRGPYILTAHPCRLLDADVKYLAEPLKPVIESWQSKGRESEIIQFGRWLGRRLPSCNPLIEALAALAKASRAEYNSESAAQILYQWEPSRFDSLVPELLKLDQSWSLKPLIYQHLSRRRQSLLSPYLGQTSFKGRFATGKNRIVPDYTQGFKRWTKKQLATYSRELCLLVQHETADFKDKHFGIFRLCRLPEPNLELLERTASLTNKDVAIRDLAIRQMADSDNGSTLPILISCLDDERARQAIYALRGAVLAMEPELALKLLKAVPSEKVSIFKEIVRLAGDTRSAAAFAWLCELEKTDLHRDVRVALLRAFWNYPEDDETWTILKNTVAKGDPVFVATAIRLPAQLLSSKARTQLLQIYKASLLSKETGARLKTLYQISISAILDPALLLAETLAACLASAAEDECRSASCAIADLYAGRDLDILSEYLESIVGTPRNLSTYIMQLQLRFGRQPEFFAQDARNLCRKMKLFPKTAELSVSLAAAVLPCGEFIEMIRGFDESGILHFGIIQAACQSLSHMRGSAIVELEALEEQLRQDKSENLRRIGLATLCGLGDGAAGWTAERLLKLRLYRKDPSLMVASSAEFTLPSAELL